MSRTAVGLITLSDINDGLLGARSVTRYLYLETESDTPPSAPSATLTWSTGVLSDITSSWSEDTPQVDVAGTGRYWVSILNFYQASSSSQSETTSSTGSTPVNGFTFDGIVTFSNNNLTDGTSTYNPATVINDGTTTIDGSTITTGTIEANRIDSASGTFNTANIPNLNADKITAGTINVDRIQANSIDTDKISIGGVATTNIASNAVNVISKVSGSSDNITGTQGSSVEATVAEITVTTTGGIITILGQARFSGLGAVSNALCSLERDTTYLASAGSVTYPAYQSTMNHIIYEDTVGAGTYTYKIILNTNFNGGTIYWNSTFLQVMEAKR